MSLWSYIQQGGAIMYILLLANIIGLTLLLWRALVLFEAKKNRGELGTVILSEAKELLGSISTGDMSFLKDLVAERVHRLEFGLNTIKIIASVSPLLGLLGTVVGILTAFQKISSVGLSDPSLFAGGIAMALITTVGGLVVAIPHFIGHHFLVGLLDDLEIALEKDIMEKIK